MKNVEAVVKTVCQKNYKEHATKIATTVKISQNNIDITFLEREKLHYANTITSVREYYKYDRKKALLNEIRNLSILE